MSDARASFFSSPDTVMRSHLTGDELHLVNERDPAVSWRSPSVRAFVIGHWIQSLIVVGALLVALVVFVFALGPIGFRLVVGGVASLVLAVELTVLEVRLFFRTYLRYIITPTRIIRMDGIIERRSSSIEWSNITDISDHLGVLGQFFDFGNIAIETANENSKFGELVDVPNPREFLERMNEARSKLKRPTPIGEAALRALVSLDQLLQEGGLLVHEQPVLSGDEVRRGWRVSREVRVE